MLQKILRQIDFTSSSADSQSGLVDALCEAIAAALQVNFESVADDLAARINSFGYKFELFESSVGSRTFCSPIVKGRSGDGILAFDLRVAAGWPAPRDAEEWILLPARSGCLDGLALNANGRTQGHQIEIQALLEGLLTAGLIPHLNVLVDEINQLGYSLQVAHMGEVTLGPSVDSLSTGPHEILYNANCFPGPWVCFDIVATWSVLDEHS